MTPEMVTQPHEELDRLLADPGDPSRRERYAQAGRKEQELLRESIWRRQQEILIQHQLPLTDTRVEMLVGLYFHFDGDLKAALQAMGTLHQQVRQFEERFQEDHDLTLHFEDDAVDGILEEALNREVPALSVCQNLAEDLEHALKLVRDRTSQDSFLLTREAIENLEAYLNQVIRDYYQKSLFRE